MKLLLGLLLRRHAEEFAGVGAFHFGADVQTGDIDELMLLSVGTVDEAWATWDRGAEGEFCRRLRFGLGGDGRSRLLGFRLRRGGRCHLWLRDRRGWFGWWRCGHLGCRRSRSRCGFGLALRLRLRFDLRLGLGGSSDAWSGLLGLDGGPSARCWCRARLLPSGRFGLALGDDWAGSWSGVGASHGCIRHHEGPLGVRANNFGARVHTAHIHETCRIGEGGADVAVQAIDHDAGWHDRGWADWSGGSWNGLDFRALWHHKRTEWAGCNEIRVRSRRRHAVGDEGKQSILANLLPSLTWWQTAGGQSGGGQESSEDGFDAGTEQWLHGQKTGLRVDKDGGYEISDLRQENRNENQDL